MHEKLIHWRRDFHRYPEPAWCEYRTSSLIAAELSKAGYVVTVHQPPVDSQI